LLLYLFRWVPSLQEFSLGMLFVTNLQRGHVHLSCFSLVDDGLLSVFLSWVFLFCSLISCCCCCCCWWVGCGKLGFRKKWVLRKSWGFWCSLLYLSKRFEFGAWSLLLLFLLLSLDFLQNCQICCFGWWICFCFVFLFLYGWVGGGGRERSELKKRQRRRLLIEEEASIATEGKPNLSFSLCLLGSIKYIPPGTTLLCLSQVGVGVLSALLRF
jgi:hypothetical protein